MIATEGQKRRRMRRRKRKLPSGGLGTTAELTNMRQEDESSDQGFWKKGCLGALEAGCECECVCV